MTGAARSSLVLPVGLAITMLLAILSLRFGLRDIAWPEIWNALFAFDPMNADHITLRELRLSRVTAALIGGAALGLAGALMQAMTRNPLADPGLLGVNGGAAIGVVLSIWILGASAQAALIAPALIGAGIAAVLVLVLGGAAHRSGPDPTRLVLAGAALSALFLALTWAVLLMSREALDVFRFWVLGGFTGISMTQVMAVLPVYAVGFPLAFLAARLLSPLILGDDAARALGVRVWLVRLICVGAVVLLCGATVSLAGPIAFVGLLVPHLVRPFTGVSIPKLALGSTILGACLATFADLAGRFLLPGREVEAGVVIAMIGGPALVILVRRRQEVPL